MREVDLFLVLLVVDRELAFYVGRKGLARHLKHGEKKESAILEVKYVQVSLQNPPMAIRK